MNLFTTFEKVSYWFKTILNYTYSCRIVLTFLMNQNSHSLIHLVLCSHQDRLQQFKFYKARKYWEFYDYEYRSDLQERQRLKVRGGGLERVSNLPPPPPRKKIDETRNLSKPI